MTDYKELELRVRTQLDGVKDLKKVADGIKEVEDAIDRQSDAAKRGESVLDELKGSLAALAATQKELKGQNSLIKEFQGLDKAIGVTSERIAKAQAKYDDYNKALRESGKTTDEQEKRLAKYGQSLGKLQSILEQQTAKRDAMTAGFAKAGVSLADLNGQILRNLEVQGQLGVVYQKGQAAVSSYAQTVAAARKAEKERQDSLNAEISGEKKRIDIINQRILNARKAREEADADAAAAAKRANDDAMAQQRGRLAILNQRISNARDRNTRDVGLAKTAQDAEDAARSYTSLARAADTLVPKTTSLRDAVDGLINPGKVARSTLQGLEGEVSGLAKTIGAINGPVTDYRANMQRLAEAQKAIVQQAGLVDQYRRQAEALRTARAEYTKARTEVGQYAAAVRQGGESGASFVKALGESQVKLKAASEALKQQLVVTRQSREALRSVGASTADLAGTQQRLIATANQATQAVKQLDAAVEQYGNGIEKAERKAKASGGLFSGDGGRTTLSLMQRIRGEVLALVAAYSGLYAIIGTAKGSVDAANTRDQIENRLSLVVGNDPTAIATEFAYVAQQADRLKTNLENAAVSYSKFAVAARKAGAGQQETRYIFESFLEASRVLGLSGDQLNGLFLALEQSFSKGKIQAEELRGQIGERLPGAFAFAQEALKKFYPDLDKALEKGQVGSENLVLIAESVRKAVAERLPQATKTAAAAQEDLNNSLFEFRLAIADSGFLQSYTQALQALTGFLRSEDGAQFAKSLGKAFKGAADAVVFLAKNFDTVTEALKYLVAAYITFKSVSAASQIGPTIDKWRELGQAIATTATRVRDFAAAWPVLTTAVLGSIGAIASGFLGFKAGEWARREFTEVRQASTWAVTGVAEGWAYVKGAFQIAMDALPTIAKNALAAFVNVLTLGVRKGLSILSAFASGAGFDGLASTIDGIAASLKVGYDDIGAATAAARRNMQQEVANIKAIRADMLKADLIDPKQAVSKAGAGRGFINPPTVTPTQTTTSIPPRRPSTIKSEDDGEVNKRARKVEEIQRALEALDAKIDRSQTETLQSQLNAIDSQYASLVRKIKELGGAEAKGFMEQLTKLTNDLRKVTTDKFNDALLKEQASLQDKLENLDAAAGKKEKLSLEARQNAIRLQYADLYRELNDLRLKFFNNNRDTSEIDAAKERLDNGIKELTNIEARKFAQEELNRKEERMNLLIKARDAQIAAIRAQLEAGAIDDTKAAADINAIYQQTIPAINAAAEATRLWAEQNAHIFNTPEDKAIFLANLEAIRLKTTQVTTEYTKLEQTMIQGAVNAVNNGLNMITDALGNMVTGQMSVSDGFRSMLAGFANFAAQFLRDIALMIIKMQIFKAMQASGNPILSAIGSAGLGSMGVKHSGGVIGHAGGRVRHISPSWFAGAPRYHTGGIAGIRSDEYPTILQRGEEVLAADSPRNVLNGGAALGGGNQGGGGAQGVRVVVVDDRAKVPEAMNSADGERVFMQFARRNIPTLKQLLK